MAALLVAGLATAEGVLTVTAPLELQVCQRSQKNQATLTVSGTIQGAADQVEVKVDLAPGVKQGQAVNWTTVAKKADLAHGGERRWWEKPRS